MKYILQKQGGAVTDNKVNVNIEQPFRGWAKKHRGHFKMKYLNYFFIFKN